MRNYSSRWELKLSSFRPVLNPGFRSQALQPRSLKCIVVPLVNKAAETYVVCHSGPENEVNALVRFNHERSGVERIRVWQSGEVPSGQVYRSRRSGITNTQSTDDACLGG